MVLYGRKIVFLWERKVHFPIIRFGNRREGKGFGFGATAKKTFFHLVGNRHKRAGFFGEKPFLVALFLG